MSTELAKTGDSFRALLARPDVQQRLSNVAGKIMTAERVTRLALTAASRQQSLMDCTPESIIRGLESSARLGLDITGINGEAFLVPFFNKKLGKKEAVFIAGYRGLAKTLLESDKISAAYSVPVFINDHFEFKLGTIMEIDHKPELKPNTPRSEKDLRCVYTVIKFSGEGQHIEVMTKAEIDSIRRRSKSGQDGPWVTDYIEMARKTCMRKAAKHCPVSSKVDAILSEDNDLIDGEYTVMHEPSDNGSRTDNLVKRITKPAAEPSIPPPPPAAPEPPAPHQEDSRAVPEATAEQVETQSEAVTPEQSNQIQVLGLNLIDRVEPGKEECTSGIVSGSKIYKTSNGKEYLAFYVYDPECEVGQDSKVRFTFWDINDQDAMASIVDMSRVEISFTRTVKNNKVYYNALSVRPAPCSTPF